MTTPSPPPPMAGMMETMHSTSGFTSETSLSGRLRTPPYTPHRATKRRLDRAESPASTVGSIHAADTSSPAKKAAKRAAPDNIKVEELAEGDAGYSADIDVAYPEEVEENDSDDSGSEHLSDTEEDDESEDLPRTLSNLNMDEEKKFHEDREEKRSKRRAGIRSFKRSHSQSTKTDVLDAAGRAAWSDHDSDRGGRRQRRKLRAPRESSLAHEIPLPSSPETGGYISGAAELHVEDTAAVPTTETEAMDVDAKD